VSAEAVREAASLLVSLGHQVQEIATEVEEGSVDNFITVWIARTGDEVTRTSGSAGASSTSTSSSRSAGEMYALSSQINAPTTWARLTGCAATRGG
jgi:hypothetical protein